MQASRGAVPLPPPKQHTVEPSELAQLGSDIFAAENSHASRSTDSLGGALLNGLVSDGSISPSRLPDFLSFKFFQSVLRDPTTSYQMRRFSQDRMCAENLLFLEKVDRYNSCLNELARTTADLYHSFISPRAASQISLPHALVQPIVADIKVSFKSTLPAMEAVFQQARAHIEHLIYTDVYPRFVKHKMAMTALRALAGDRGIFQGLGDCFCLTDPVRADNPIVHVSDGFLKVSGYSRAEIIPRNCRFLQGAQTDKFTVRRLKTSIEARQESIELLLNYRRTGEPFWNLLYVAPLFNQDNELVFFLGGQINCSTTIHNNADMIRILSRPDNADEEIEVVKPKTNRSRLDFFRSFRSQSGSSHPLSPPQQQQQQQQHQQQMQNPLHALRQPTSAPQPQGPLVKGRPLGLDGRPAGMESELLSRIERLDVKSQMAVFHSAYSKYLVLSYDDLVIRFFSTGIIDMLDPALLRAAGGNGAAIVGYDVFRFLGRQVPGAAAASAAQVLQQQHALNGLAMAQHPPQSSSSSSMTGSSPSALLGVGSGASSVSRDYKNRVRSALKQGLAVSLELRLRTRRSAIFRGDERFATHWTPLKDEAGKVRWVVLTMSSGS